MFHLKRYYILCIAFFVCILLSAHAVAQPQARGFGNAAPAGASMSIGRTVALVVGVSDYPYVAPLNYAAEDALLMNDFLQSKAGGNVPIGNIRFLANEEATLQNVWTQGLSWLENTIKPTTGDRVIIYLAGHGDAISSDESFFLCYNANPAGDKNNYHVTGALNITILKNRIAKFSAAGAEVVLIMDACRSGDLPGVREGIANPFESVVERKAGETLMLSASANQLAVEDRRWGRGHGVFTWNLIQGLSGKADENGDGSVDFYEIEQYTRTNVRKETQAMGRMQVPQFAASPSVGGVLGRADNAFLNKLSTEALSAVSVSESIALARSAAESSWFTDSTLYAGFNEIKKLVRQNKYLGEGSAEPICTALAEKFSAEQIEPVRLYYMSALASKGFEAINQELFLDLGLGANSVYYEKRLSYLLKARQLQIFPNEVNQLDYYIKLLEVLTSRMVFDLKGKELNLSKGLVDTLSSMKSIFGKSAAYFYWMAQLGIDPVASKRYKTSEEYNEIFIRNADSCYKFAPDWPLVKQVNLVFSPVNELTDSIGEELSMMSSDDPTNGELLSLLQTFYARHRPYNTPAWLKTILDWCKLNPNSYNLRGLLELSISINEAESNPYFDSWLMAEALKNHYHHPFTTNYILSNLNLINDWISKPIEEDFFDYNFSDAFHEFILYAKSNNQILKVTDILIKGTENWPEYIRTDDLAIVSSLLSINQDYAEITHKVDSLLKSKLDSGDLFASNSDAAFIAYRIQATREIEELKKFRLAQMQKLSEFDYPGFNDELILFKGIEYIADEEVTVSKGYADSLLNLCRRMPDVKRYGIYYNLCDSRKWPSRLAALHTDSLFQMCKDALSKEPSGKLLYYLVESKHCCFHSDTLGLKSLMRDCLDNRDTSSFMKIIQNLEANWQKVVERELPDSDFCNAEFTELVKCGFLELAEKKYNSDKIEPTSYLGYEQEIYKVLDYKLAAIKLFNLKGNYMKSSEILEELILFNGTLANPITKQADYRNLIGPYDAFIQSKEFKAMMARVYTAPEK